MTRPKGRIEDIRISSTDIPRSLFSDSIVKEDNYYESSESNPECLSWPLLPPHE